MIMKKMSRFSFIQKIQTLYFENRWENKLATSHPRAS